jgi:hypothetical protein
MKNILAVHSERQMQRAADEFAHYGEWGGARERWPSRNNGRPLWNELKKPVLDTEKILFVGWKAGRKLQLKERWTAQLLLKKRLSVWRKKKWVRWQRTPFLVPLAEPGISCAPALFSSNLGWNAHTHSRYKNWGWAFLYFFSGYPTAL